MGEHEALRRKVEESRQAIDELIGMVRAQRSRNVTLRKDDLLALLEKTRSWIVVPDLPEPPKYKHVAFSAKE
ncbi:MAG: hypothetical protein EON59_13470 [Alphaproteobacteria bacterium]|nr:MAG: hypothetical protein EON59_13470 [Alphaproteobacteria bacterium]